MRYQCIARHRNTYPVRMMCDLLKVARSGFYAWLSRPESKRVLLDRQLTEVISRLHSASRGVYGAPKIRAELESEGYNHGKNKVARLMRQAGLRGCPKRRFKITTMADPSHSTAPNRLNQDFTSSTPSHKWASDITFIATQEGWLYLAVVMDLYSRRIIGWSMSRWISRHLALDALGMALANRKGKGELVHHSDRGSQYTSEDYRRELDRNGIECSMSRRGNCYDNAVVESFFGIMKRERVHFSRYLTRDEARADIFDYIECFYNRKRRHGYLGYVSPVEFENRSTGLC